MSEAVIDGREVSLEEYNRILEERRSREVEERWELRKKALGLLRRMGEAYLAYKEFVEDNPQLEMRVPAEQASDQKFYELLRRNLEHANEAPRCMHVKADGLRCGSPRMKTGELCFAHQRMVNARALRLRLSSYEDANGVQMALMEISRAVIDGQITERMAGLLLYGLQTASANVSRVTFHRTPENMVVEDPETQMDKATGPPPPGEYERYCDETMDPDLRRKLMELGDEIDRRMLERQKAAGELRQ